MYPNLYYAFKDLFDIDIPFLKVVNSFGFFVAISFLVAAWLLIKELKRRQALGEFTYRETTINVGKPATLTELVINFLLGFLLGFKIIGVFIVQGATDDPQSFIFSREGSWPAGIFLGLFFAGLKWWEKNKNKLPKPEERKVRIWPSDRVGDITIIAAASGFIGAKIFDNLENWNRFIQDPVANLLSPSGLTFYGGLIVAILVLWYYFHKKGISFIKVADATAPSLMIAYGIGRAGCQVAGDGDWGILNSAYISNHAGGIIQARPLQFNGILQSYGEFYAQQFGTLQAVPHAPQKAILGLPDWFFAYSYPHNVNKEGIPLPNCNWGDYCMHLPLPVYPTPLYEIIMSLLLFALLWSIRKRVKITGRLFAIYLVVNGIERFLIEKIRVNTKYNIFGFHPTQAEIISFCFIIAGIFLYIYAPKIWGPAKKTIQDAPIP
ncbi:MAG TPA: prolipoprotein diacylglyceryl transferase family protein [Chitinophagaceae bacterium]|jgi:prolipoprotein diacylglyceryltransferase